MNPVQLERTVVGIVDEHGVESNIRVADIPDPILKQEVTLFLMSPKLKIHKLVKKLEYQQGE